MLKAKKIIYLNKTDSGIWSSGTKATLLIALHLDLV